MYLCFLASVRLFHDATTLHLCLWPCLGSEAGRDELPSNPDRSEILSTVYLTYSVSRETQK